MSRSRPQLELGVAARADLQQGVFAAIVQLDAGQALRVAAVEAFGQPQDGREASNRAAAISWEIRKVFVTVLWRRAAVVPGDQCDGIDFLGLEAPQIAVLDQIVRVFVVALVADVRADVVEQRGVLEPFTFPVGQSVHAARLLENRDREARDVIGMLRPVVAPFRQLHDAAAADVGIAIGLRNLFPVARDVVEHEPFAQRHVAQRDLLSAQAPDDRVEQDGTGNRQIGAARLEPGHPQSFFEAELDELSFHSA